MQYSLQFIGGEGGFYVVFFAILVVFLKIHQQRVIMTL